MTHKKKKEGVWLYKPIKEAFEKKFKDQFGNCHLEITYRGRFSERLMNAIPSANDVTFFFMGRRKAPDITGFIGVEEIIQSDMAVMIGNKKAKTSVKWPEFIVVEVKNREISLEDVLSSEGLCTDIPSRLCFSYVSKTYTCPNKKTGKND